MLLNFIPKNLFKQLSVSSNLYFFIVGFLEMVKEISDTNGTPIIFFPLFLIIGVSSLKDYIEDRKRKDSDNLENNRKTKRLENGTWKETIWRDVFVGDIIKVKFFFKK